ncbi:MAG TPA: hypothetical protein VM936_12225 [Pyrinomonadaceae bacterium]|nr:hypothetical protein [Pyrinomonadaceae bacterium]
MGQLPRRTFVTQMLGGALTFSLVRALCGASALRAAVRPAVVKWLAEVEEMSSGLKGRKLRPSEWQAKVEELFRHRVELKDLLRSINYDELIKHPLFPEDHESALELEFPKVEGLPEELTYIPMFVAFKKGAAIVPHGHHNMVSMHMALEGVVRARHYERRGGDGEHLIIEPTLDKTFARGELSTVSDERNNIHWFKAESDHAFMFNVAVFGLDGTKNFSGRHYIDPLGAEKLGDGTLRARRIDYEEAKKLYGNT